MNRYKSRNSQQRHSYNQKRPLFNTISSKQKIGRKLRRNVLPAHLHNSQKKFSSNSFNKKRKMPMRMKRTFLEKINAIQSEASDMFNSKDSKHTIKTKSGEIYKKRFYSIKYKTKLCVEILQNGKCRYG